MPALLFILLLHSVTALLTPMHFSSSFLLNLSSPALLPSSPSCGFNLGSDSVRLDLTATLSGSDSLPVSPAFYYHGGKRCRRTAPDHADFFILHPGLYEPALSGRLKDIASAIERAAGSDAIVTAQGAHLREAVKDKFVSIAAVLTGRNGAIVKNVAAELVPGPVRCGSREVMRVLYARASKHVDLKDNNDEILLRMVKGRMYAVVETEEELCFYEGTTRAPEGEVEADEDVRDGEHGDGVSGLVIALSITGIVALAGTLASVFGTLYVRARRKERLEEREEEKDIVAEEGGLDVDDVYDEGK